MTEEQKAALEILDKALTSPVGGCHLTADNARTLKAMVEEPRLPERPNALMVLAMQEASSAYSYQVKDAYRALYAHLTQPRTKTVEVWRVEYSYRAAASGRWTAGTATYDTEKEAKETSAGREDADLWRCIRVTGPHQQEVPA